MGNRSLASPTPPPSLNASPHQSPVRAAGSLAPDVHESPVRDEGSPPSVVEEPPVTGEGSPPTVVDEPPVTGVGSPPSVVDESPIRAFKVSAPVFEEYSPSPITKTNLDLQSAGISPSKIPSSIKKQLHFANAIVKEIKSAKRANKKQSSKSVIHGVVCGKIVKEKRLGSYLQDKLGIDRRRVYRKLNCKLVNVKKLQRLPLVRKALRDKVTEFLSRDDNSRMQPGKKDFKKSDENEEGIQCRILSDYIFNLFTKFKAEFPNIQLKKSNFFAMRPNHILLTEKLKRRTCLCTKHQNISLKLKMINRVISEEKIPTSGDAFIKKFQDQVSQKELLEKLPNDDVTFEEWQNVNVEVNKGKTPKIIKRWKVVQVSNLSKSEFIKYAMKEFENFRVHSFNVATQYAEVKKLKENLPLNHCLIQMDFAENYYCQEHSEIQSGYFGEKVGVMLHPCVIYYNSVKGLIHKSVVFISSRAVHDKYMVFAIIKKLIPLVKDFIPDLLHVHYYTDSPVSQYRNRYMFYLILCHPSLLQVTASWDYSEAGHGKGPCDGVGGTVKRMADQAVKQGNRIQSGWQFFQWAIVQTNTLIQYQYVTEEDYTNEQEVIDKNMPPLVAIDGTLQLHAVKPSDKSGCVLWRETSCNCMAADCGEKCGWKTDIICPGMQLGNSSSNSFNETLYS